MSVISELHTAAQYLAMAGKSFVEHKDDDSHTNLGWKDNRMVSHELGVGSGLRLALNHSDFSLELMRDEVVVDQQELAGHNHSHIIAWIRGALANAGLGRGYTYKLHYELPYRRDLGDLVYSAPDRDELASIANLREVCHDALRIVTSEYGTDLEVRIWPHHFDSGGLFAEFEKDQMIKSIGVGLAIPDTMCNDFYFYTSAWVVSGFIDLTAVRPLPIGEWKVPDWQGAIYPASGAVLADAASFFRNTIGQLNVMLQVF